MALTIGDKGRLRCRCAGNKTAAEVVRHARPAGSPRLNVLDISLLLWQSDSLTQTISCCVLYKWKANSEKYLENWGQTFSGVHVWKRVWSIDGHLSNVTIWSSMIILVIDYRATHNCLVLKILPWALRLFGEQDDDSFNWVNTRQMNS